MEQHISLSSNDLIVRSLWQIEFHEVNKQIDFSRSNIILLELDA